MEAPIVQKENAFPELEGFLNSLRVGEPQVHKNMTVYPVFSDAAGTNGYKLLDEAIKTELFQVSEISHSGSVPELQAINKLDADVLILDGEELVGAKQNRIVNTTIIVAKGRTMVIPVSCVEQGRWTYRNKRFTTSKWSLNANIRKEKSGAVKKNLKNRAEFASDQSRIWSKISEMSMNMAVSSETGAMGDVYETCEAKVTEYELSFPVEPDQIGFVVSINGKIVGCDVLALTGLFPKIHAKLLRGYILDAVERLQMRRGESNSAGAITQDDVHGFLEAVRQSRKESFKSQGEGLDIRFDHSGVDGFALCRDGSVIHVAAFPKD